MEAGTFTKKYGSGNRNPLCQDALIFEEVILDSPVLLVELHPNRRVKAKLRGKITELSPTWVTFVDKSGVSCQKSAHEFGLRPQQGLATQELPYWQSQYYFRHDK